MTGKSYWVPDYPVAPGEDVPKDRFEIIESMPVKSLITYPASGVKGSDRILARNDPGDPLCQDQQPQRAFVVGRFQEGDQGLGHRPLAGDIEAVAGADGIQGACEIVAEAVLDLGLDRFLGRAGTGQKDRQRRVLGALDPFRVADLSYRADWDHHLRVGYRVSLYCRIWVCGL